jgi:hypothetical protein
VDCKILRSQKDEKDRDINAHPIRLFLLDGFIEDELAYDHFEPHQNSFTNGTDSGYQRT